MLQTYTKEQKNGSKQATEHSSNVVVSLQSKLANTSMSFKDVLEIRTEVSCIILMTDHVPGLLIYHGYYRT